MNTGSDVAWFQGLLRAAFLHVDVYTEPQIG